MIETSDVIAAAALLISFGSLGLSIASLLMTRGRR